MPGETEPGMLNTYDDAWIPVRAGYDRDMLGWDARQGLFSSLVCWLVSCLRCHCPLSFVLFDIHVPLMNTLLPDYTTTFKNALD